MWKSIFSSSKSRQEDSRTSMEQPTSRPATPSTLVVPDVMGSVYEVHPNMSVFHDGSTPLPVSPPGSPTRGSKRFKRMSKLPVPAQKENVDTASSSSTPFNLSLSIPKRMKAKLNLDKNGSEASLSRSSGDALRTQDLQRPSYDSLRNLPPLPPTPLAPDTPFDKVAAGGSLRSILKDKNAPGTGRSVRFFPKDAFKTISPDPSSSDLENTQMAHLNFASSRSPPRSVMDIFPVSSSPSPSGLSLNDVIPSTDVSDFFQNVSMDMEPPSIAPAPGMSVNAFEVADSDAEERGAEEDDTAHGRNPVFHARSASVEPFGVPERTSSPGPGSKSHDRSQSFSFGQTIFQSMARTFSTSSDPAAGMTNFEPDPNRPPVFRPRTKSDTLVSTLARTVSAAGYSSSDTQSLASSASTRSQNITNYLSALSPRSPSQAAPEADIADLSSDSLVVFSKPDPDPFAADAGTYYTPESRIPQTPPEQSQVSAYFPGALSFGERRHASSPSLISSINGSLAGELDLPSLTHSRGSSRDDEIVAVLRNQLALQEQMTREYELDLAAKDELVSALQERLANTSMEADQRRSVARNYRRKVAELERACRMLEQDADRSAQDIAERSVFEEASSDALRIMHQRVAAVEAERKEAERTAAQLKEELKKRDDQERLLREGIRDAQEQIQMMTGDDLTIELAKEKERWNNVRQSWGAEKADLAGQLMRAEEAKETLAAEVDSLRRTVKRMEEAESRREEDMKLLQGEVEAQWKNTEQDNDTIRELKRAKAEAERERDETNQNLAALEFRMSSMESDFTDGENRRQELEEQLNEANAIRDELEHDREELEAHLQAEQAQIEELSGLLQEREDRITELTEEVQYAQQNVSRLEENVRQRDAEASDYSSRLVNAESAAEELREELSALKREHARATEQKDRALADAQAEATRAKTEMESALQRQAHVDVNGQMLQERTGSLESELEKLRRQVHDLRQDSAAKDMKIVQFQQQIKRDREDMDGMNIAIDSKQQDLERLKREMAVRNSAGAAQAVRTAKPNSASSNAQSRRDSYIPSSSRPASAMSDVSTSSKASESGATSASAVETVTPPAKTTIQPKHARKSSTPLSSLSSGLTSISARKVKGAMGPPATTSAIKPRGSIAAGTPSRIPNSGSNSNTLSASTSSATPSATVRKLAFAKPPPSALPSSLARPASHRRASSSLSNSTSASNSRVTSPVSAGGSGSEKEATPKIRKLGVATS